MLTLLLFLLVIGIIVLVHESGHFIAAKLCGIKVEEFAIGFGLPFSIKGFNGTLFSFRVGETLYRINVLPLGGYVKMAGEGEYEEGKSDPRFFEVQPTWKKLIVLLAGVCMNFLLACLIYSVFLFHFNFVQYISLITPNTFPLGDTKQFIVFETDPTDHSSPIYKFHLTGTYMLKSIDGKEINTFNALEDELKLTKGKNIVFNYANTDGTNIRSIKFTPRISPPKGRGVIGIALSYETAISFSGWQKPFSGIFYTIDIGQYNISALISLTQEAITTHSATVVTDNLAGPVGVYEITNIVVQQAGFWGFLNIIAVLSLAVALMNVLPFPVLDGGLVFIILIEALIRRKLNATIKIWIANVGVVLLILLMVYVTYNDISNFNIIGQILHLFGH